jgi:hypothetical protein
MHLRCFGKFVDCSYFTGFCTVQNYHAPGLRGSAVCCLYLIAANVGVLIGFIECGDALPCKHLIYRGSVTANAALFYRDWKNYGPDGDEISIIVFKPKYPL